MSAIEMEKEDIEMVMSAVETLETLNKKYGAPHGKHPMGIVLAAYSKTKSGQKKHACKCDHGGSQCCGDGE